MLLAFIFLDKHEYLEKILSLLAEVGVSEATIIEGQALGHFLAFQVPIFAGLRQLVGEKRTHRRAILALLPGEEALQNFTRLLTEEGVDFKEPGTGTIVVVPVTYVMTSP
mgnify:CR=1 FL=1